MKMKELETKIGELEAQSHILNGKIMSESYIHTKTELQKEQAQIKGELTALYLKRDEAIEEDSIKKLHDLIIENRTFISFKVNNDRIEVDKKGNITITFSRCKHQRTFPISERLQANTKRGLFERWRRLLNPIQTTTLTTGTITCVECRKAKNKKLKLWGRYTNTPIPSLAWELRILK